MDIHAESLENLLASVRQYTSPLTSIPGLPAFNRGEVIEIQGPASSGKTHLLYHILLSVLVPVSRVAVVVYDTDTAFDIQRFRHLLLSRISRLPSNILDPQESVRRALGRLHLFRPTSLIQLAASIANLPAYHASHMPNQEIAVLAIDSISTFYWADRFSTEQLRDIASKDKTVPMVPSLHHVLDAVQRVQRSHCPLAILTNWALNSALSHPESMYKQHLHPFPRIDSDNIFPDPGAKASGNTDRAFSSPLHLAHHITLSSPLSEPFPTVLDDTYHSKGITNNGHMLCFARSSGALDAIRLTLEVTDDDTSVTPQQSIKQVL